LPACPSLLTLPSTCIIRSVSAFRANLFTTNITTYNATRFTATRLLLPTRRADYGWIRRICACRRLFFASPFGRSRRYALSPLPACIRLRLKSLHLRRACLIHGVAATACRMNRRGTPHRCVQAYNARRSNTPCLRRHMHARDTPGFCPFGSVPSTTTAFRHLTRTGTQARTAAARVGLFRQL